MVWNDLKNFRDETLDVVNPTKSASPGTEKTLRNVPLLDSYLTGADMAKGYSNTVDAGPNAPMFERIGMDYRDEGIVNKATGDASNAVSGAMPDLPNEGTMQKYGVVVGGFLLVLALLNSTTFNVGGGS